MDQEDVKSGTACMNEIAEVLKKHNCTLDIRVSFSSIHGPSFQVIAIPMKTIILPNQMPPNPEGGLSGADELIWTINPIDHF